MLSGSEKQNGQILVEAILNFMTVFLGSLGIGTAVAMSSGNLNYFEMLSRKFLSDDFQVLSIRWYGHSRNRPILSSFLEQFLIRRSIRLDWNRCHSFLWNSSGTNMSL